MNQEPTTSSLARPRYVLISVERAEPLPAWLTAGNWYRYIIRQGSSDMKGYKTGSLESVTEYAETVAAELNERAINGKYVAKRGRPATPLAQKKE
jgi:hypothetical protein